MPRPFAGDHGAAEPREVQTVTNPLTYAVLMAQDAARNNDFLHSAEAVDRRSRAELLRKIERVTGTPDPEFRATYRRRFNDLLLHGNHNGFLIPAPIPLSQTELRDLGVGIGAAGGFLVPQEMADQLVVSIAAWSKVYANCRRITTEDGAPLPVPVASGDTANSGVIQPENVSWTSSATDVTVAQVIFNSYAVVSLPIRYSWALAMDVTPSRIAGTFAAPNPLNTPDRGGFRLIDQLSTLVGQRLGRKIGQLLAVGTGSGQPTGLAVGTRVGLQSATGNSTKIAGLSDLVALEASVDPAYRDDAVFVTNPATWQSIITSVSTSSGVVLNPFSAEQPPTLLGYPVLLDPYMPTMAASAKHTYFGALSRSYACRTVGDPAMLVLRERFAEFLEGAVITWVRLDGNVLDPKAGALLQNSAT